VAAGKLSCVQEPGETLVIPDGWRHSTCNLDEWTVGWGGQGRYRAMANLSGPRVAGSFGATAEAVLSRQTLHFAKKIDREGRAQAASSQQSRAARFDGASVGPP